mmetsp:Transcript_3775/g.6139  ORF Transcript_3775/g.6139 Transcript_3775/m.6139 type:complete len:151 (+) Transcript_3775:37-489(+)
MLRGFTRSRILYQNVKKTTGIVGLKVEPNGRKILQQLYKASLDAVKPFPKDAFYRTEMEHTINERLNILEKYEDIPTIEKHMNAGQIEEVIEDARDELDMIPDLLEAKIWEDTAKGKFVILPSDVHGEESLNVKKSRVDKVMTKENQKEE